MRRKSSRKFTLTLCELLCYNVRSMVEYLRPKEVCERLGIGRTTFVRWVKQGKIRVSRPTLRTTYVSTAELARFYNANAQPVPGEHNRRAA